MVGENGCVCLILSQRIERNKPRRDSRPSAGWGGPLPLYRRQLSSQPYQNHKPSVHSSIRPSKSPIPPPLRSCPEFRPSARPPIRPLCHLPFLYQDPPHPRSRSPRHPRPGFPMWVGGGVGAVAIPNEYTIVDEMLLGARAATRPAGARGTDRTVLVNTPDTTATRLI